MKKYYDLYEERLVAMLDWEKGYGIEKDAQEYFKSKFREISKKEFEELGEKYSSGK